MFGGLARMLAVAALAALVLAAPAAAAATPEPLVATGSITYAWQGDPERGCAAVGVCNVSGALIVDMGGTGSVTRLGAGTVLNLDDTTATVRVLSGSGSTATTCIDGSPAGGPGLFVTGRRRGALRARFEAALSSGRCAGPRAADLARLELPVRKSGGSHPSFDLRTSQGFAAGPFSGRLISTVRLRPDRTKQVLSGSFGVTTTTTAPPRPKVLVERVRLNYRVRALPGTLDAAFMGATGPFCTAVGSCGASGSLALALGRVPRTLTLEAFRPVPRRVGAARVIADLRRGLLGAPFGSLRAKAPGLSARVSETFVGADGSRCQASAVSHEAEIDFGGPAAPGALRGVPVALSESPDAGMWRTYCPGPDDSDMFGERSVVATASLRVPQLLRRHIVVVLANRGGFSAFGYAGSRSGDLALALTLVGVNAGVDRESL